MKKYSPETLFALARYGIEREFYQVPVKIPFLHDQYHQERACFVTLMSNDRLRGCIGSLLPHQSLKDDIISNAYSAAFKDYRFSPLSEEEYQGIKVSVSVLTVPQPVLFEGKEDLQKIIQPGRDGIVFSCQGQRSTFLPHVWEQLPDFDAFFAGLSQKAGLGNVPDFDHCRVQSYQVEKYDEQ